MKKLLLMLAIAAAGTGCSKSADKSNHESAAPLEAGKLSFISVDDVDAQIAPGQLAGITLGQDLDRLAVDRDRVARDADIPTERSIVRVVLEQVRALGGTRQVVDRRDLQAGIPLEQSLREIAADSAEPVDSDAHSLIALDEGNFRLLSFTAQSLHQAHQGSQPAVDRRLTDRGIAAPAELGQGLVRV